MVKIIVSDIIPRHWILLSAIASDKGRDRKR